MDIGEHSISLPTLTEINDQVDGLIRRTTRMHLEALILRISDGEKIPIKHLMDKYLPETGDVTPSLEVPSNSVSSATKQQRKLPADDDRCMANISNGTRCTRKKKTERFCGSHSTSRKYGEVYS